MTHTPPHQDTELIRLSAFSETADGGNPAGVWIGERLPHAGIMLGIAHEVGYSETAFNVPNEAGNWTTRYYSPEAEVPFCGHATIATGVALGERFGPGTYSLQTVAGTVHVDVVANDGRYVATLTSVEPQHKELSDELRSSVLDASVGRSTISARRFRRGLPTPAHGMSSFRSQGVPRSPTWNTTSTR